MAKLLIEIESQETGDGFKKSLKAANDYEAAILQLIVGEKELARQEALIATKNEATAHFQQMTAAEKEAYLASHQLAETTQQQGFSFTELNSAIGIAQQAYSTLKSVLDETYGTYAKNAEAVRDLALISGTSAEETSRFIQVLDDYQVSAEDAEAATRKLKENGMVPTIDTLAKLADQYQAIQDPAQKMAFIQDNLGRGGTVWINVLNQNSDALRANAAAVNENLIFTDKQIADYEKQRLALDALSDSWEGLKNKVGAVIGTIVLDNEQRTKAINILKEQGVVIRATTYTSQAYKDALQQVKDEEAATAEATKKGTAEYEKQSTALKEAAKAAEEAAKIREQGNMAAVQAGISGVVSQSYDDFAVKTEKLTQDHAVLQEKLQQLIAWGWSPTSEKVQELNQKLSENETAQRSAAEAMQEAIDKMIFQQASAGLDSQATLELARAMGMMDEQSYAVATSTEALHQQFLNGSLSASEYALKVAALRDTVNQLHDKSITITANILGMEQLTQLQQETGKKVVTGSGQKYATGGSFIVPNEYGYEGFALGNNATASAGELITITPKGGSSSMGSQSSGGGDISSLVYAINNSRIDEARLARAIVSAMKREV